MDRVAGMMELFRGQDRAHGTYSLRKAIKQNDNKIVGKAVTVMDPVTKLLWEDHLAGREGIGIIPIRDDSTCLFGAIDVDIYPLEPEDIIKLIVDNELPLIPCRTKSGGLHLYTFVREPIPAATMRSKLSHYAAVLGYADAEIFPKQDTVLADRGDLGGWINVPYFGGNDTDRYAYDRHGEGLKLDDFLEWALASRKSPAEFEAFTVELLPDLQDGPPCLQYLITRGFVAGTRNDGMYNLAIYLKRVNPDGWRSLVNEFNVKYFDPALMAHEVESVIKSVAKKDYDYTCGKAPLRPHCNSGACRLRKYGVGALLDFPVLTALTKRDSTPPIWFVDVEGGGRLELSTEDLQQQMRFQRVCLNVLNVMTPIVKPSVWADIVRNLLANVTIIQVPEEVSPTGQLLELLEKFCTSAACARSVDELLLGKPFTDRGRTYFRFSDFLAHLNRKKFTDLKAHQVASTIADVGGESELMRVQGRRLTVWSVPEFERGDVKLDPKIEEPPQPF